MLIVNDVLSVDIVENDCEGYKLVFGYEFGGGAIVEFVKVDLVVKVSKDGVCKRVNLVVVEFICYFLGKCCKCGVLCNDVFKVVFSLLCVDVKRVCEDVVWVSHGKFPLLCIYFNVF